MTPVRSGGARRPGRRVPHPRCRGRRPCAVPAQDRSTPDRRRRAARTGCRRDPRRRRFRPRRRHPRPLAPPIVLPPPETAPQGPATGTGQSAPTAKGPATQGWTPPRVPAGDPAAGAPGAARRPRSPAHVGPSIRGAEVRAETGPGGRVEPGGAAGPGGGTAPAGGEHLARLSPAGGQGGAPRTAASRPSTNPTCVRSGSASRTGSSIRGRPCAAASTGVVELEVRLGSDGRLVAVEVVAGTSAEHAPRRGGVGRAGRGAVPVPAGTPAAAARHPPSRRVPAALRGRNSRFFFDPPGTWAIVDGAMALDVTTVLSGALLDALGRAGLPTVPASDVAWEVPQGSHPRGLRDQRGDAPRQVSPAPAPPGGGGDPRASPGRGRDRARRGRGTGIPQRVPLSRVLPGRAGAGPGRGRPLRHGRRGARAARHGGVRQRQPHGAADARPRPAGNSRGLRGPAFPDDGLRNDPRVLLQQRGAPDARARRIGPRPVPGAPRPAGGDARGRLPGRLHPGDRGRASRPAWGVARGRGSRERLPPGRGGRHLRRHPADPRALRHSFRRLLERSAASTPRGRSRPPSRRSERPGSSTTRTARSGSGSPPSAGRRTACW